MLPLLFPEVHDHLRSFVECRVRGYFPGTRLPGPSPPPCRLSHHCW
jgi:hypothetical protein